jgi:hypothetical protein
VSKEINYRSKPTKQCPYLLETTPHPHYVSATHKTVELILISRFGKRNIPAGNFWRLADTSKEVYGAQKYLWPVIKRLEKTYDGDVVLNMVVRRRLKYLSMKLVGKYLYWCKEEKDLLNKVNSQESRYNKEERLEDKPVIDIKKKKEDNLLDWLDS